MIGFVKALGYLFPAVVLIGCAAYSERSLVSGRADYNTVVRVLGEPALRWQMDDGGQQLAFPRGPAGTVTYMVWIGRDGKLTQLDNVLRAEVFATVHKGMATEDILRLLGPPVAAWTAYFDRRDELVWGWRFCDELNHLARFFVLFDAGRGVVRSTLEVREELMPDSMGDRIGYWCSR